MTEIKVGDRVRLTGPDWAGYYDNAVGSIVTVSKVSVDGMIWAREVGSLGENGILYDGRNGFRAELVTDDADVAVTRDEPEEHTPVSPQHYKFPGGEEVISISQWLTSNTGQALQYIARSSRIDGKNKGNAVEDIQKAIKFLTFELERLK